MAALPSVHGVHLAIPEGTVAIPGGELQADGSFWGVDKATVTSITIPTSVISIGERAFDGCSSLESITIPTSVSSIGKYAFHGCRSLASVAIPTSVSSIGDFAFDGCTALVSVEIPTAVTAIGFGTFMRCSALKRVGLSAALTRIGKSAFAGCSSLTTMTIPTSVTSVGEGAFLGCSALPPAVRNIPEAPSAAAAQELPLDECDCDCSCESSGGSNDTNSSSPAPMQSTQCIGVGMAIAFTVLVVIGLIAYFFARSGDEPFASYKGPRNADVENYALLPFPDDGNVTVFVAYGQSNAGCFGDLGYVVKHPKTVLQYFDGNVYEMKDPMLGDTGVGGCPWGRLGDMLVERGVQGRIVFVAAAAPGHHIEELMPRTAPATYLLRSLRSLRAAINSTTTTTTTTTVLFQQGESDAISNTPPATYGAMLNELITWVQSTATASIRVAASTR